MEILFDAENVESQFEVIRGHPMSNGLPMLYGLETWLVESSPDAENIEVQFKVTRGHPRSNGFHYRLNINIGGWIHMLVLTIMRISSRSTGVTQGQMTYH